MRTDVNAPLHIWGLGNWIRNIMHVEEESHRHFFFPNRKAFLKKISWQTPCDKNFNVV